VTGTNGSLRDRSRVTETEASSIGRVLVNIIPFLLVGSREVIECRYHQARPADPSAHRDSRCTGVLSAAAETEPHAQFAALTCAHLQARRSS
jgi:hypothetical protein